ncbi:MAG: sortase [Actinomycetota bacterium]
MAYAPPDTRPPHRSTADRIVRVIGVLGRIFVAAGLVLLFFTGYLLWGTGVYTKQQQVDAKKVLESNPIVDQAEISEGDIPPARPPQGLKLGDPLFSIKIPKIGLDTAIVQGVGREELKKGPGLFPDCDEYGGRDCVPEAKYPGENGNVAISGHRTTYGAPFYRIQELAQGDIIDFISGRARYRYKVRGSEIVDPVAGFNVVLQHGKDELTLTTCHPRFSAAQRLIINADYVGASLVAAPQGPTGGGARPSAQPVVGADVLILASIALASALASLGLSKRYKHVAAYIALGLAGAAGLWIGVFPRVIALMPANY